MKKILTLYIVVILIIITGSTAKAFSLNDKECSSSVKEIRVGLKGLSSTKVTLSLNGRFNINNKIVSNRITTTTINGNKLIIDGKQEDVVDIRPLDSNCSISAKYKGDSHYFEGRFILRPIKGRVLPINVIPIESYIKGVLPYEMSSSYPLEALKAQAVSARNYAVTSVDKHRNEKFDVCDGIHCQVYRGIHRDCPKIESAVESTSGEILMEGDEVVKAFFYSSNGGVTESSKNIWNSEFSYLSSQRDEFDTDKWSKDLTTKEINKILKKKRYLKSSEEFVKLDKVNKCEGGRVRSLVIKIKKANGTTTKVIDGEGTRTALGLKSNYYNVDYNSTTHSYKISGGGFGHGVGLSQLGAKNRALNGHSYRDILSFYYKGTSIKKTP